MKFQFHIGAIRRSSSAVTLFPKDRGFNSILVQLEVIIRVLGSLLMQRFNSILVQLEARQAPKVQQQRVKFQFHIGAIRSITNST